MNYWLLKTEPETFSFDDLLRKKIEPWDGVRNYQARNNIAAMLPGDSCLIYHSVSEKAIVGIATVASHPYPDPTTNDTRWLCIDIEAVRKLDTPITLEVIKETPQLSTMPLIKHTRLSVMPIDVDCYEYILKISK